MPPVGPWGGRFYFGAADLQGEVRQLKVPSDSVGVGDHLRPFDFLCEVRSVYTVQQVALPNGLKAFFVDMPWCYSTAIGFFVRAGSRYDPPSKPGLAHLTEHMFYRGTSNYPDSIQVASASEKMGAFLRGTTTYEWAALRTRVHHNNAEKALELLGDIVINSLFSIEDFEKEKNVILEEIVDSEASDSMGQHIAKMLFNRSALSRPILGTRESLQRISHADVVTFRNMHYTASNACLVVAGKIPFRVGDTYWGFERIPPTDTVPSFRPVKRIDLGPKVRVIHRPSWEVVDGSFCFFVEPACHESEPATNLLNSILGEGVGSRLSSVIREKHGLVYDVNAELWRYSDVGVMRISFTTSAANIKPVVELILSELATLRMNGITEGDLAQARPFYELNLWFRLEHPVDVRDWLGVEHVLFERLRPLQDEINLYSKVTCDDVFFNARRYFQPSNTRLLLRGPVRTKDAKSFEELIRQTLS